MNSTLTENSVKSNLAALVLAYSALIFVVAVGAILLSTDGIIGGMVCLFAMVMVVFQAGSMWAVLGPGQYWRSALISFAACTTIGISALTGMILVLVPRLGSLDDFARLLAVCPLIWIANQLPFWVLRFFRNWRIVHDSFNSQTALTIIDLMTYTAFTAMSLAIFQSVFAAEFNGRNTFIEFFLFLSIQLGASFLLVSFPALFFLFGKNSSPHTLPRYCVYCFVVFFVLVFSAAIFNAELAMALGSLFVLVSGIFGVLIFVHKQHGFYLATKSNLIRIESDQSSHDDSLSVDP